MDAQMRVVCDALQACKLTSTAHALRNKESQETLISSALLQTLMRDAIVDLKKIAAVHA
jgi:hypothetical protein